MNVLILRESKYHSASRLLSVKPPHSRRNREFWPRLDVYHSYPVFLSDEKVEIQVSDEDPHCLTLLPEFCR